MSESKALAVDPRGGSGEMFDRIAARYDLMNRIISLGIDQRWRRRTVDSLALKPGAKVLDLATGTGDLALMIARRHPEVSVVGFDPSTGMLSQGERKVAGAGLAGRVQLRRGEAERIDVEDASIDGISMAFGIRNVVDRPAALREMARALKPGGRVAILELSEPRKGPLATLARVHIHHVVPTLGALLSGAWEYRYLQRSIAAFPPAEEFAQTMREAGLTVERAEPMTFGVVHLYVGVRAPA